MGWFMPSVATLVAWGIWGFAGGLSEKYLTAEAAFMWHCVGIAVCALIAAPFVGFASNDSDDIPLALAAGAFYSGGTLAMIQSIRSGGPTGVVVLVTSLYPFVVLVLNMGSTLTLPTIKQAGGSVVAFAALFLVAETDTSNSDEGHKGLWWLVLSIVATIGFAMWVFCLEHAVPYPEGPVAIWQAVGTIAIAIVGLPPILFFQKGKHGEVDPAEPRGAVEMANVDGTAATREVTNSLSNSVTAMSSWLDKRGVVWGLIMGLGMAAGTVSYMIAAAASDIPSASTIVVFTGMYPIVSLCLSRIFLAELINARRALGIVLALAACVILAT